MTVYRSNTTVIIDYINGTILDLLQLGEYSPYPLNISEFFTAWTAPLNNIPVNITLLLETDYLPSIEQVDSFNPIFINATNNSNVAVPIAHAFIDSLLYSFTDPLPSESPALHLRASLAHALVRNSGLFYDYIEADEVSQTYILNISAIAFSAYIVLNSSVIVACLWILVNYLFRLTPNTCLFPELAFGGKLKEEAMECLKGHSNTTTALAIEYFRDIEIRVTIDEMPQIVITKVESTPQVVITRRDNAPLCPNVESI